MIKIRNSIAYIFKYLNKILANFNVKITPEIVFMPLSFFLKLVNLKLTYFDHFGPEKLYLNYFPEEMIKDSSMNQSMDFLVNFHKFFDAFVDIGANRGKWTDYFLCVKPNAPSLLIEPIPELANFLKSKYTNKSNIKIEKCAVSDTKKITNFYVTRNDGQSSSLLNLGKRHLKVSPDADVVQKIKVKTRTLFEILKIFNQKNILLKIDVQGHELEVLKSAKKLLQNIIGIHIEISCQTLYEKDTIGYDVWSFLQKSGFILYNIDPWFRDFTSKGELLQADFYFIRENILID